MQSTPPLENPSAHTDPAAKQQLVSEIADVLLTALNLRTVKASDIVAETKLAQNGLELDSIDILEVVIAVEQHFQVKVKDPALGRTHFASIGAIADFILACRASH